MKKLFLLLLAVASFSASASSPQFLNCDVSAYLTLQIDLQNKDITLIELAGGGGFALDSDDMISEQRIPAGVRPGTNEKITKVTFKFKEKGSLVLFYYDRIGTGERFNTIINGVWNHKGTLDKYLDEKGPIELDMCAFAASE